MRAIYKIFIGLIAVPMAFAEPMSSVSTKGIGLKFQIIQDQFTLDHSNVKSAILMTKPNGSFGGLEVQLKPFAVQELQRMTNDGVGRTMNMVINNRIISAPALQTSLGQKFIIASITKEEALAFINLLNSSRQPPTDLPVIG